MHNSIRSIPGILQIRDLTKRDVVILAAGAILSICVGLLGLGGFLFFPLIIAVGLVPLVRLLEHFLALRVSDTTLATVVEENTDTYRVGHGRYSHLPPDYYVVLQPVVEFETKDGTVRVPYGMYRDDRIFLVGEEYEICYSVKNPRIFYFTCRKNELVHRYALTLGLWGFCVCLFLLPMLIAF